MDPASGRSKSAVNQNENVRGLWVRRIDGVCSCPRFNRSFLSGNVRLQPDNSRKGHFPNLRFLTADDSRIAKSNS